MASSLRRSSDGIPPTASRRDPESRPSRSEGNEFLLIDCIDDRFEPHVDITDRFDPSDIFGPLGMLLPDEQRYVCVE